jgi:hypothetical protein
MQRPIQEARRSYPLYSGVSSSRRRSGRGDAHHRRVYRRRLRSSPRPVPALRVQTTRSAGRTEHARSAAVAALAKHDILLDRGLGAAGIAVASATVEGTRDIPFTIIKTASPALGPLGQGEPVSLTPNEFHYAFANTVTREESNALYARYAVPAPGGLLTEHAFANSRRARHMRVAVTREARALLLFIAFGEDHDAAKARSS